MIPEFSYPILWIGEREVRASTHAEHFQVCQGAFLEAGHRKRGVVVDSNLMCWRAVSTRVAGYAPPLWGLRLPGVRHYLIDYEWSDEAPRKITLNEVKELIITAIRKSGIYVGMAGSSKGYEGMISGLSSFSAIVDFYDPPRKKTGLAKLWASPLDG